MRKWIRLFVVMTAFFAVAAPAQSPSWRTYANERFGSRIEYPAYVFDPEPPPENGDGLRFKSRDGAEFTISASYNVIPDTLQSLEYSLRHPNSGDDAEFANVTYRMSRGNILVLSGFRGDRIYYDKFLFSRDQQTIHHFAISYPASRKIPYGPIVERMSKSLTYVE